MIPDMKTPDNSEIDQALKEFEEKSALEQAKMPPKPSEISDLPKMVQLVMKWSGGAIKEQKQAEYVLSVFALVIIGISLYLFFK